MAKRKVEKRTLPGASDLEAVRSSFILGEKAKERREPILQPKKKEVSRVIRFPEDVDADLKFLKASTGLSIQSIVIELLRVTAKAERERIENGTV